MKHVGLVFSILIIFVGCGSSPVQQGNNYLTNSIIIEESNINQRLYIVNALLESSNYLESRINYNSKIAIFNIQSPTVNLTNYLIDSLSMHLVNKDKYQIIERSELYLLEQEQHYQISGSVSDETAVSIGKQLGTQYIVTGSILPLGDDYSFRIKVINVETAQNIGTRIYNVIPDRVLLALLEPPKEELPKITADDNLLPNDEKLVNYTENKTPQTVIQGDINITNNNTTNIQGDVYINIPQGFGW